MTPVKIEMRVEFFMRVEQAKKISTNKMRILSPKRFHFEDVIESFHET